MKKTIIGVTGQIASGKNEVCGMLKKKYGAYIIDADKIGHEAIKKNTGCWKKIVEMFGKGVLFSNGFIDRKKLGGIVFTSRKMLKRLNAVVHPAILKIVKHKVKLSDRKTIIINAAVLAEIGLVPVVGKVIAVISSKKNRIKRLTANKSISKKDALLRINIQRRGSDYIKNADIVIRNGGSLAQLDKKIKKLKLG